MDYSLTVGILALILAIPLAIIANILTPTAQRWWATTSEVRKKKRIAKLQAELQQLTANMPSQAEPLSGPAQPPAPSHKQPLLRVSNVHTVKLDDLYHAVAVAVENVEHRYPTTAHNLVASISYTPFRGEPLKISAAPWRYLAPVVNTRTIYADCVSLSMSESKDLILLLYEDPVIASSMTGKGPSYFLPSLNVYEVQPQDVLDYGEWDLKIDLEGDNFVGKYGFKVAIAPKPGFSVTPVET